MLSSHHKLLFIKRMHLIGVAFYEPKLDPQQQAGKYVEARLYARKLSLQTIASNHHLERLLKRSIDRAS